MTGRLLAAFGCLILAPAFGSESLVPRAAWIDRDTARLALVDTLRAAGEMTAAENELRAGLREKPADTRLRLRLADLLASRGHAAGSRAEFDRALAGLPSADPAWLAYAARLDEWGEYRRAEQILRAAPSDRAHLRLLAATLAGAQQFEEAAAIQRQILLDHPGDTATRRDLETTLRQAGELPRLPNASSQAAPQNPSEARLQRANTLAAAGDLPGALAELEPLRRNDPEFLPAVLRRAELLAATRQFPAAFAELDAIDATMPGNTKAAFTRARALSWNRDYAASLAAYDAILAENPSDPTARLEKARVAAWAKRQSLSQRAYRALWDDPQANPRRREAARLEARAKQQAWDRHFLRATRTLRELTTLQAGNQEAWFDFAQSQAALGLTDRSAQAYDSLLTLDPLHRMAGVGRSQAAINARPAAIGSYWYWDEKGTGRLSDITRQRIRAGGEIPVDSRFYVRAFSESWIEQPDDGVESFFAQGFALEAGGAINEWLSASAHYAFKAYTDPALAPTNTGGADVSVNLDDYATLTLGYAREDEIHNRFSLFQGTQADNFALEARSVPLRQLELTTKFVLRRYTDANWQQDVKADIGILLLDHPHSLKLVFTGQYLNTEHQSIFLTDAAGQTTDVIHPYWTPRTYFRGLIGLEWRQDLARDFFAGAPRHYYGLVVRGGTDTTRNNSISFAAEYLIDLAERWTFQAQIGVERSPQWNGASAFSSLSYRF